jgi:hypothetical protein
MRFLCFATALQLFGRWHEYVPRSMTTTGFLNHGNNGTRTVPITIGYPYRISNPGCVLSRSSKRGDIGDEIILVTALQKKTLFSDDHRARCYCAEDCDSTFKAPRAAVSGRRDMPADSTT